jgi:hypothetical protein
MIARLGLAAMFSVADAMPWQLSATWCAGHDLFRVKEALDRDGNAVLYRQGESSISLYDRFVGEKAFCQAGYTTASERIAVADTDECPVRKCIEVRRLEDESSASPSHLTIYDTFQTVSLDKFIPGRISPRLALENASPNLVANHRRHKQPACRV